MSTTAHVKLNLLPIGNNSKYGRETNSYGTTSYGGGKDEEDKKGGRKIAAPLPEKPRNKRVK